MMVSCPAHSSRPTRVRSIPGTGALPFFLALCLLLSGCSSTPTSDNDIIRVMTFNIRWANPDDGDHIWENRSSWVASIIDSSGAHVVGLQEVLSHQLGDIMKEQTRLAWVGVGRNDGLDGGEYSPILYDSTRFRLLDWGTRWLSAAPDSIGSVGWDAALPRIATLVTLEDRMNSDTLRFINTHFDHRGEEARIRGAGLIANWMENGVAALGDFNFEPDTDAYRAATNGGLVDAGLSPSDPMSEAGTFRSFDPSSETSVRIDYVFHNPAWQSLSYRVLAPIREGAYPSDHLPVVVDLQRPID